MIPAEGAATATQNSTATVLVLDSVTLTVAKGSAYTGVIPSAGHTMHGGWLQPEPPKKKKKKKKQEEAVEETVSEEALEDARLHAEALRIEQEQQLNAARAKAKVLSMVPVKEPEPSKVIVPKRKVINSYRRFQKR